ncbi:uncharacterized protein misp3 [Mastacembelus armatus]|uniref:MISP family member 3 n=1 Tax=Mastacembelus armatus TaxID=205130 RepID=A0A3Q3L0N6_9TELE|nr:uncharacterized protein LOC113127695 [Mastacembelus armatus]
MATMPMAWQEQGPANSLDNESWALGEGGATTTHSSLLQNKKAPRVEPEEDVEVLEPGTQDETLQNQTFSHNDIAHANKPENQKSTTMNLCTTTEKQGFVPELEQVPQKQVLETLQPQEESEKTFPPTSLLNAASTEECFEKEGFSSLEGEVAEWINDADIIVDSAEDLMSLNSQEWPHTPLFTERLDQNVDATFEKDSETAEEGGTQLHFISNNNEPENNTTEAPHYSVCDSNNSDDVDSVCSPPFADESEEEEEDVKVDVTSNQKQQATLQIPHNLFQSSYSTSASVSAEQEPTTALPAVPSAKHQEEVLPQSQCELAPRGTNQEAAQQVHGQSSPPLSAVAMELFVQGGAVSPGSGCVVPVRKRHSRVGERTEGESKPTGREEQLKDERKKVTGHQHCGEVLEYSQRVQVQEVKTNKHSCGVSFEYSRHNRMESDSCDDSLSDSGLSADFSPCGTLESNNAISSVTPTSPPKETPIEREIRRAVERERSLRRSRGLPNPPTSPEYVEIPSRNTVLCKSFTANPERLQGKDRQFAGKKMQHEIHKEAQREQDLVKLGKIPGFYDKGTVRQLKDKKQLFETFQKPDDSTLTVSARNKTTSLSSASDVSTLENQEDVTSQASTIEGSYVERRQNVDMICPTKSINSVKGGGSPSLTSRGLGSSEPVDCQVIILESNLSVPAQKLYYGKQEPHPVTAVDSGNPNISSSRTEGEHGRITRREQENEDQDNEEVTPRENPFFRLRTSTNLIKVEQDIWEAQEREKELRKQRISIYGCTGGAKGDGGGGRPASINGQSPSLSSSSSLNGLTVPDLPGSSYKGVTGPSSARQSIGRLGMWPPAQAEEEKINGPEVTQNPRTPRQKTLLIHHWESGLVNGRIKDDGGDTDGAN